MYNVLEIKKGKDPNWDVARLRLDGFKLLQYQKAFENAGFDPEDFPVEEMKSRLRAAIAHVESEWISASCSEIFVLKRSHVMVTNDNHLFVSMNLFIESGLAKAAGFDH